MNLVVISGNITKDPELRYTASGTPVATMTLAVKRPFAKENDEKKADFFPIIVWKKPAENCANYLHKGSKINVVGRLQERSYDSNGQTKYVTEVIAENVEFLDPPSGSQRQQTQQTQQQPPRSPNGFSNPPYGGGSVDISDDDLPF
jgi:single-strand DNA-binding protein